MLENAMNSYSYGQNDYRIIKRIFSEYNMYRIMYIIVIIIIEIV